MSLKATAICLVALPFFVLASRTVMAENTPEEPSGPIVIGSGASEVVLWTESSLQRVYPKSPAGESAMYRLPSARNRQVSFQICLKNKSSDPLLAECTITDPKDLNVRIRRVGYVPLEHLTPGVPADEIAGKEYLPGLVPDPLFPEQSGTIGPYENLAFWITVQVPAEVEPGERELVFQVQLPGDKKAELKAVVDVLPFTVDERHDFPVTHWWRANVIWQYYGQEPWSDEWFAMTEKYVRNMVEHGSNVLLVPALEFRRETFKQPSQMLIVNRNGDQYTFDWHRVRRFVQMAKDSGVDYFEWPHLWIYWGVTNPMVVYEKVDGEYKPMWSVESDGFSESYINFLRQYLDSLHEFLVEEEILENSYFHLSDEPNSESIERYAKARGILREIAPWMEVMDALSDVGYGKRGITDIPVPIVSSANGYIEAGIPHWVYYCTAPRGPYLNRFMDTPLAKIRMSGWLFYRLGANGFLHWGYNYWSKFDQEELADPFTDGDAEAWALIPFGDPFVVYPGPDGPIDSIRWEVFAESLQDYAMLQTAGVSPEDPLLMPIKDYGHFPKDEEWIRQALNDVLMRSNPAEEEATSSVSR